MSELRNKTEGSIKKTVGRITGDEELKARGEGQKTIGQVQEGGRKVKEAVQEGIGKLRSSAGKSRTRRGA